MIFLRVAVIIFLSFLPSLILCWRSCQHHVCMRPNFFYFYISPR
uniref:Uncharacterized protein n=1 Tax=Setaria viridis TaxID=4556 RepID=A0A4U6VWL0_SETVI|nr:hypothetical protein SEVIR_2G234580v2 [Setaria viridis]